MTGKGDTMTNDKLREAIAALYMDALEHMWCVREFERRLDALLREHGREVTGCGDCPAVNYSTGSVYCKGVLPTRPIWRDVPKSPPTWCPLRKGPVMLWLRERKGT
jgi:hypothetical protein